MIMALRTERKTVSTPGDVPEGTKVPIIFVIDCPPCECCEEPFCETHKMHYADCSCVGPHNAAELGFDIRVEDGKVWGYKR